MSFDTNIDASRYRTAELQAAIAQALELPSATGQYLFWQPLLATLACAGIGAAGIYLGSPIAGGALIAVAALAVWPAGYFWGVSGLVNRALSDTRALFQLGLDLTETLLQSTAAEGKPTTAANLLRTAQLQIVLPMVREKIQQSVSVGGGAVAKLVEKILSKTTESACGFLETGSTTPPLSGQSPREQQLTAQTQQLAGLRNRLDSMLGGAQNWVARPVAAVAWLVALPTALVVGLLAWAALT